MFNKGLSAATAASSSSSKGTNKGNQQRALYQTAESRYDSLRKQREDKVIQVRKERRTQLQSERRIVSLTLILIYHNHRIRIIIVT